MYEIRRNVFTSEFRQLFVRHALFDPGFRIGNLTAGNKHTTFVVSTDVTKANFEPEFILSPVIILSDRLTTLFECTKPSNLLYLIDQRILLIIYAKSFTSLLESISRFSRLFLTQSFHHPLGIIIFRI